MCGQFDEEAGYERRASVILTHIRHINEADWLFVLDYTVAFAPPYDRYYAFENWAYWVRNIDFECLIRSIGLLVFLGGQNVEEFAVVP